MCQSLDIVRKDPWERTGCGECRRLQLGLDFFIAGRKKDINPILWAIEWKSIPTTRRKMQTPALFFPTLFSVLRRTTASPRSSGLSGLFQFISFNPAPPHSAPKAATLSAFSFRRQAVIGWQNLRVTSHCNFFSTQAPQPTSNRSHPPHLPRVFDSRPRSSPVSPQVWLACGPF